MPPKWDTCAKPRRASARAKLPAQYFADDIAKPEVEAIRTSDESLNWPANQRLRTFMLVTMPGNAATSV